MLLFFTFLFLGLQDIGEHQNAKNGLAVSGFDVVSYFNADKPKQGLKSISVKHQGITYQFANEKNKASFLEDPSKYTPAYGGWCAYAMGVSGDKVKVDPETFKILDDRLYLFYNFWGNNTLTSWNDDENNLQKKADKYWANIIGAE